MWADNPNQSHCVVINHTKTEHCEVCSRKGWSDTKGSVALPLAQNLMGGKTVQGGSATRTEGFGHKQLITEVKNAVILEPYSITKQDKNNLLYAAWTKVRLNANRPNVCISLSDKNYSANTIKSIKPAHAINWRVNSSETKEKRRTRKINWNPKVGRG